MKKLLSLIWVITSLQLAAQSVQVPRFHVYEMTFTGPMMEAQDNPVRDIMLNAVWRHESGSPEISLPGFYDGDGKGGPAGDVYKIRFTPTRTGTWTLVSVSSNAKALDHEQEGHEIQCIPSDHAGFWLPDAKSAGQRWYQRSNGDHPYLLGNTMYTFLSESGKSAPNGSNIRQDVEDNARYYNKLRFALTGDIFPHPVEKPFLDIQGNPTDDGNFSHRPNPKWFLERVDLAVQTAFDQDLVADLILNGPDSPTGRSNLVAAENGNDPEPFLRYIAARYGSYPNVWICMSNEFDIRKPNFSPYEMKVLGHKMASLLTYSTPLSIHGNQHDWDPTLNTLKPWNDHLIIQNKLKQMWMAADVMERNYWKGEGQPVINDELAYEGARDNWTEEEVLKAFLGTFLGGGYGSTGYKSGPKLGGYFSGKFDPEGHSASDNLLWFREVIGREIQFWHMQPFDVFFTFANTVGLDIFRNVDYHHRLLAHTGEEYVLGGSGAHAGIVANKGDTTKHT